MPTELPPLDHFTQKLIERKARWLASNGYAFGPQDREDLEQELSAYVLAGLRGVTATGQDREAIVTRLVKHRVAQLIRAETAQKRDFSRLACSEPSAYMCTADDERKVGGESGDGDGAEQAIRAMDVQSLLACLPARLRRVAEMLMEMPARRVASVLGRQWETFRDGELADLKSSFSANYGRFLRPLAKRRQSGVVE